MEKKNLLPELTLKTTEMSVLNADKKEELVKEFSPKLEELNAFNEGYMELIAVPDEECTPDLAAKAKRMRLDIGKVRTSTDKIRKDQKSLYLKVGQAIDGIGNIVKNRAIEMEANLKTMETYLERREEERLRKLQAEREDLVREYVMDPSDIDLASMQEEVFTSYLNGLKLEAEKLAQEEAEEKKKAEEEAAKDKLRSERFEKLKKNFSFLNPEEQALDLAEVSQEVFNEMISSSSKKAENFIRIQKEQQASMGPAVSPAKHFEITPDTGTSQKASPVDFDKEALKNISASIEDLKQKIISQVIVNMKTEKGQGAGNNVAVLLGKINTYVESKIKEIK